MMIIIPMAGLSSRFFEAGYQVPKYMLEANGKTIFAHSVSSFENYFDSETFIFIIRDIFDTKDFVEKELLKLNIKNYVIHLLNEETQGQADTVAQGLNDLKIYNDPITIFNIDTVRKDFRYPSYHKDIDGYLEVFIGEGKNWSFVKPSKKNSELVSATAEKKQISKFCSNGLYGFKTGAYFINSFNQFKEQYDWECGELYIAPIYNVCIMNGGKIKYRVIETEKLKFIGTPEEFINFSEN